MLDADVGLRPARRRIGVIAYSALGPLASVVLASTTGSIADLNVWLLIVCQAAVGAAVFAILRPGSYRRSTWRALMAAVVLVGPSIVLAASSVPIFELPPFDPTSPYVWSAIWFAGGLIGCLLAALVSGVGHVVPDRRVRRDLARDAPVAAAHEPGPRDYWRLGVVIVSVVVVFLGTTTFYLFLSFPFALAKSHIDGNVPDRAHFDGYLERDLTAYFRASDSSVVSVSYELLRRSPTQVGIAYPKYYAWVRVTHAQGSLDEGAVRLAAIEKARFDVTDFVPSASVLSRPELVREHFPQALNDEIKRRAGRANR